MRATRFPRTAGGKESGSFNAAWKRTARSLGKLALRLTVTAPALDASDVDSPRRTPLARQAASGAGRRWRTA